MIKFTNLEKGINPTDKIEIQIKYITGDIKKIKTIAYHYLAIK